MEKDIRTSAIVFIILEQTHSTQFRNSAEEVTFIVVKQSFFCACELFAFVLPSSVYCTVHLFMFLPRQNSNLMTNICLNSQGNWTRNRHQVPQIATYSFTCSLCIWKTNTKQNSSKETYDSARPQRLNNITSDGTRIIYTRTF